MFMQTQAKYVWDIAVEEGFTGKKLTTVYEISHMIAEGGEVQELRGKLLQLGLIKK